jgi:hypothetical protein
LGDFCNDLEDCEFASDLNTAVSVECVLLYNVRERD